MGRVALIGMLVAVSILSPVRASAQGAVSAQELIPDARSQGMGRAFTAVAEGPAANWWNPGALGLEQPVSFSPYSAVQLVPDLADDVWLHTFGATAHTHRGGVGFGAHFTHLSYGKSVVTNFNGDVIGEFESTENVLLIGAGANLLGPTEGTDRLRLGVGSNLKIFDVNYWEAFSVSNSAQAVEGNSFDIDVGTLLAYRLPLGADPGNGPMRSPHLDFRGGLAIVNLLDRDIHFDARDESDPLVRRLRLGGALELNVPALPPFDRFDHLLRTIIAADRLSYHGEDSYFDPEHYVGMEISVMGLIAYRAGHASAGFQGINGSFWGWGVGADLRIGPLSRVGGRVDFASVPQAPDLQRIEQYTVTGWLAF